MAVFTLGYDFERKCFTSRHKLRYDLHRMVDIHLEEIRRHMMMRTSIRENDYYTCNTICRIGSGVFDSFYLKCLEKVCWFDCQRLNLGSLDFKCLNSDEMSSQQSTGSPLMLTQMDFVLKPKGIFYRLDNCGFMLCLYRHPPLNRELREFKLDKAVNFARRGMWLKAYEKHLRRWASDMESTLVLQQRTAVFSQTTTDVISNFYKLSHFSRDPFWCLTDYRPSLDGSKVCYVSTGHHVWSLYQQLKHILSKDVAYIVMDYWQPQYGRQFLKHVTGRQNDMLY